MLTAAKRIFITGFSTSDESKVHIEDYIDTVLSETSGVKLFSEILNESEVCVKLFNEILNESEVCVPILWIKV